MKAKVSRADAVVVKNKALNKDQLHSEDGFIRYCTMGYNEQTRRLGTTQEFLAAAEREGLIIPMLEEEGIKFYSPHHLAMVVALRKNVVKNGRLESEEQMAWSQVQPVRTLLWGSSLGVTVVADTGKPIGNEPYLNDIPRVARALDSFLRLVHSYPQAPHAYTARAIHRQRMFNGAPVAYFDFSELTKHGEVVLKHYGLTIDDLVFLRKVFGGLAAQVDPLEYWYEYMSLHPQDRKDKLKGDALIAQEMYLTCDIIADVIEAVTGAAPLPLMKALHADDPIKPFLRQRQEFAPGTDTYAMKACMQKLRDWVSANEDKGLSLEPYLPQLITVESHLDDFITRYGHMYRLSGVSQELEYNDTPLDQFDSDIQEEVKRDQEDGWDFGISEAEGGGVGYLITEVLYHRLDDVNRELGGIVYGIRDLILQEEDKAWRLDQEAGHTLTPQDERHKLYLAAKAWDAVKNDFDIVSQDLSLVYCNICHEHPIALHHEYYDSRISDYPICDACFKKVSSGALKMTEADWAKFKGGEWRCGFCVKNGQRPILYKFAQRNVISTLGKNGTPLRVVLEYGRVMVEAKCQNCGKVQSKMIDWGWVD
jgi:hypothetical protein